MKKIVLLFAAFITGFVLSNTYAETGGLYINGGLGYANINSGPWNGNSFMTWKLGAGFVTNTTEEMRLFWGGEGNFNSYGFMQGVDAMGILGFQFTPMLSFFGKAGGNYTGLTNSKTSNNMRFQLGGGLGLQLTQSLRTTAEMNYVFVTRDLGLTAYTLNLQYTLFPITNDSGLSES